MQYWLGGQNGGLIIGSPAVWTWGCVNHRADEMPEIIRAIELFVVIGSTIKLCWKIFLKNNWSILKHAE